MDKAMLDWTAFLTDEPWFLPDPPPAGIELPDALPTNTETWPSQYDFLNCPWHPNPSVDCCWRRPLNDPFVGVEERVAGLGHFGIGFPEGHCPDTVPGSFTATHVELGRSSNFVETSILDRISSHGSDDGCFRDGADAKASNEDEGQKEQPVAISHPVELSQEEFEMPNVAMADCDRTAMIAPMSSGEHAADSDAILDLDIDRPKPVAAVACPTAVPEDQCTIYQHFLTQEIAERHADKTCEEEGGALAGPPVKAARGPGKYQRKRKFQTFDDSSGLLNAEEDDSDSDYTPDPRKKKRSRIMPTSTYKTPPATGKKPRKPKGKQVWYATSSSSARKIRVDTKKSTRDRVTGGAVATNYAPNVNYAPNANYARFTVIAKRARYALEASTIRPQPGSDYQDLKDVRNAFYGLQEEFKRVKQEATGGSRNVQQVVFADRAGDATFAEYATSAEMIIKIG
ncbi:hypothetical protein LLEC1_06790 [Akanthomyces lecanii]|uniref:Uncharacterized protein n=1 Tax=Cordyceps confragosa TaxID=2714763 RepID=A0A179IEQ2_CORDF|nr:hypothetical protein LLEC1_06790 [Akanthomyces lecanii]